MPAPLEQRVLKLHCAEVHSCRCEAVFSSTDPSKLVELARHHGARVHGFTPAFYSPERLAAMARAATEGGGASHP
jgi:hypothetical protein